MKTLDAFVEKSGLTILEKRNTFFCELDGILEDEYHVAVLDTGFGMKMPFVITKDIMNTVRDVCDSYSAKKENAMALCEWVVDNIIYGKKKRCNKGYRNSIETFQDQEGICGEMSMLYIAMVRSIGIRGSYVDVAVDYEEKKVTHACAMIDVVGNYGLTTLVDPAYRQYDLRHASFNPISDKQLTMWLNSFD